MGILNFCDPCGALRVREVKDQLQMLITVKAKPKPNHCGLCRTELDLKVAARGTKKIGNVAKDNTKQKSTCSKPEVVILKLEKKTRTIKPVHFEDLDSEDDNAIIDIPFDSINDVEEESDAGSDLDDKKMAIKVKAEKIDNSTAENKTQNKSKIKKKKKTRQEEVLTDAEFAKRQYLDERILAMLDKEGPKTKSLTCKECKKVFFHGHIQHFIKHISTHMDEELSIDLPYVCPICSHRVVNFKYMDRHLIQHKPEKTSICNWPDCKAKFASERYLAKHIRRHQGYTYYKKGTKPKRKYKCSMCEHMAISKDLLSFHENTHTQARPYKCQFCDLGFNTPMNRKLHEGNMHSTNKDNHFMCESCGYTSFFKADLKKHRRIHTGDKPFTCKLCDFRSSRRDHLRRHIRLHTGEITYKCRYCDMVFQSLQSRKEHKREMHAKKRKRKTSSSHHAKEKATVEGQASVPMSQTIPNPNHTLTVKKEQERDIYVSTYPVAIHQVKESSSTEGPSSSSSSQPKMQTQQIIPNPHHPQNLNPPPINNPQAMEELQQESGYDHSKMGGPVAPFRSHQQQPPPSPPHQLERSESIGEVSFLHHLYQT